MGDGIELVWPGKYDADGRRVVVPVAPSAWRTSERHGPREAPCRGELVAGDNLGILDAWLEQHRGRVDLVYIDPPFATGTSFDVVARVHVPGDDKAVLRIPAFDDRWPTGGGYLSMLAPRLERIHALLAAHGSLYVHVDPTVAHAVKLLLDEVFGPASFQREIVWRIGWVSGFKTVARNWIRNHDTILFYVKDPARMRFNKVYVPHPPGYARRSGAPAKAPGIAVDDVWNAGPADLALVGRDALDSIQIKSFSREKTGYATQKNESVLRRVLAASSSEGDLVADPFCGAGTTAAVALAMGRRFLACDRGEAAIQLARARLLREHAGAAWSHGRAEPARPGDVASRQWPLQVVRVGRGTRWQLRAPDHDDVPQLELDVELTGETLVLTLVSLRPSATATALVRSLLERGADPLLELAVDADADPSVMRPQQLRQASPERAIDRRVELPAGVHGQVWLQLVDLELRRLRVWLTWARDGARASVDARLLHEP